MSVNAVLDREQDIPAWVEFELRAEEDVPASRIAGKPVFRDVEYALITPPYSKDLVEKKVDKWLDGVRKQVKLGRTPSRWLDTWERSVQAWRDGQEIPVEGTAVKLCPIFSPAQVKTIVSAGMRTVESLAACNDEGLRRVGMGGVDLRSKAQAWLKSTTDHGAVTLENAALKKENEQLKVSIASLEDKVRLLSAKAELNQSEPVFESQDIKASDILDPPESLADQYKAITGRRPHAKASEEAIRARIAKG